MTKKVISLFCCLVLLVAIVAGPATINARAMGVGVATIVIASAFAALAGWGIGTMASEVVADDIADWMANDLQLWASGLGGTVEDFIPAAAINLTPLGQLLINPVASESLRAFARWMVDKYGLVAGGNEVIVISGDIPGIKRIEVGQRVVFASSGGKSYSAEVSKPGYLYVSIITLNSTQKYSLRWISSFTESGGDLSGYINRKVFRDSTSVKNGDMLIQTYTGPYTQEDYNNGTVYNELVVSSTTLIGFDRTYGSAWEAGQILENNQGSGSLSLAPDTNISIPSEDSAVGTDTNISWGGSIGLTLDQAAQIILDKVAANELSVTVTVANEAVADPALEQTIEDVDELGLPSLGTYFTTRFPFSIPWDVVRGIKLLAAPAEAPYFEVDFFQPLADNVGGWEGDTTIVLDFGQYPIIGQVTRWASLLGFCILLAVATKKLIWTA